MDIGFVVDNLIARIKHPTKIAYLNQGKHDVFKIR